jgi:HAD superfamily phosphoserine phosphatase-like hydrolase
MLESVKAVIFDVDGTLTDHISWLNITSGLGADHLVHKRIFDDMKTGITTYPEAKTLLIELWQATGNANRSFMEQMFESWTIKHDAEDVITYLKGKYTVCLMSGAVDLYIQILAEKLGIKNWYANTELIWDATGRLTDFNYFVDQATKKVEHFHEFAQINGLTEDMCVAIGDGDSDMKLFEVIKGIAVNSEPNAELEALAKVKIEELSELKGIL